MDVELNALVDVADISALAKEADAEGHRFVTRLIADWLDGSNRFDAPGGFAISMSLDLFGVLVLAPCW